MQKQVSKRHIVLLSCDHLLSRDVVTENVLAGERNRKLAAQKLHCIIPVATRHGGTFSMPLHYSMLKMNS